MTPEQIAKAMPAIEAHAAMGLLVFPVVSVAGTKKPMHEGWQSKTWDLGMLEHELRRRHCIGYGVTLPRSDPRRLIDLDLDDGGEGLQPGQVPWQERLATVEAEHGAMPKTKTTATPSGGEHRWFLWPDDAPLPGGSWHGFTVRSLHRAKNYVVGPGSVRPDGEYMDVSPDMPIATMPTSLAVSGVEGRSNGAPPGTITIGAPYALPESVDHGDCNLEVCRYSLSLWKRRHSLEEMWTLVLHELGPRLAKPHTEEHLRKHFDGAVKDLSKKFPRDEHGYVQPKESADHDHEDDAQADDGDAIELAEHRERARKRKSQGERLYEAVGEADVDLFHDAEFRAYATFQNAGHRETWPIRSGGFRRYVSWLFFQRNGSAPRAADVADFLATLEGRAQFEGRMMPAWVRIAPTDEGIALDLGDPEWTAIEIDGAGWRQVVRPTVRFIRPRGLQALPLPVKGGSIELLRRFLNVSDEDAWRLVIGVLLMMFRPEGPYPVAGFHGEQGSAKTTTMRVLRKSVDPRETLDRSAPRSDHDLAIHAMHNRVIALDNVSGLPDWLSDALARLATGSGFSTRQLYTDSDEFSFSAARPVMLNGIGEVIERSDLLDRAVLVSLDPIAETERRLEADFWADFEAAVPRILGALLDAVSTAIAREPTVTMARWPRMADFARWVTAAEPALGWPEGTFLAAYYANRGQAHELALDADPVAVAVRSLMATVDSWKGRPTELLDELAKVAGDSATKRKDWPAAAHTLSNRLERLAPDLRAVGVEFERSRGGGARSIALSNSRKEASQASPEREKRHSGRHGASRIVTRSVTPERESDARDARDAPLHLFDETGTEPPWPEVAPADLEDDDGDLMLAGLAAFADMLPEAQA